MIRLFALLVAILIPSLQQAREQAKIASCQVLSNARKVEEKIRPTATRPRASMELHIQFSNGRADIVVTIPGCGRVC